jgi:hypothetical protein
MTIMMLGSLAQSCLAAVLLHTRVSSAPMAAAREPAAGMAGVDVASKYRSSCEDAASCVYCVPAASLLSLLSWATTRAGCCCQRAGVQVLTEPRAASASVAAVPGADSHCATSPWPTTAAPPHQGCRAGLCRHAPLEAEHRLARPRPQPPAAPSPAPPPRPTPALAFAFPQLHLPSSPRSHSSLAFAARRKAGAAARGQLKSRRDGGSGDNRIHHAHYHRGSRSPARQNQMERMAAKSGLACLLGCFLLLASVAAQGQRKGVRLGACSSRGLALRPSHRQNSASAAGTNKKVDRRVPYYVLEGCDYLLDARARCDAAGLAAPGACCPIGFACTASKNRKVRPQRNGVTSVTPRLCRHEQPLPPLDDARTPPAEFPPAPNTADLDLRGDRGILRPEPRLHEARRRAQAVQCAPCPRPLHLAIGGPPARAARLCENPFLDTSCLACSRRRQRLLPRRLRLHGQRQGSRHLRVVRQPHRAGQPRRLRRQGQAARQAAAPLDMHAPCSRRCSSSTLIAL